MKEIHAIGLGFGVLIALYLGLTNASGIASIFSSGGPQVVSITKALQGR